MTLLECAEKKQNNVNVLKFIAAITVIFSHAFDLTGNTGKEFIRIVTKEQTTFGGIAVAVFFFFSGYFIMGSMERRKTLKDFFRARIARIFPQLWIVVLLSVFLLGAVLTDYGLNEYFSNVYTYKYLLNMFLIPVHDLPGVFQNNAYNSAVNGSLWTLPVEFLCYIFCYLFYRLRLCKKKYAIYSIIVAIPGYLFLWILLKNIPVLRASLIPCVVFYVGMLFYIYREYVPMNGLLAAIMFLMLIVGTRVGLYFAIAPFAYAYIFSFLGFYIQEVDSNRFKDVLGASYGIYLVAFPIQQTIYLIDPEITYLCNFIMASIISVLMGIVLLKIDRFLRFKKYDEQKY